MDRSDFVVHRRPEHSAPRAGRDRFPFKDTASRPSRVESPSMGQRFRPTHVGFSKTMVGRGARAGTRRAIGFWGSRMRWPTRGRADDIGLQYSCDANFGYSFANFMSLQAWQGFTKPLSALLCSLVILTNNIKI
ncbi:hypothetical protein EVAR_33143_1 [Eumeta japonica]|uniref:Uncharacterized protein n=1 Tax=Eumeta variegata TaxID=151549 RepID=A0A4C1Y8B8_EUMVA|nr:hypothetical protein EVAR_33143_1 [Eumeta japonica]